MQKWDPSHMPHAHDNHLSPTTSCISPSFTPSHCDFSLSPPQFFDRATVLPGPRCLEPGTSTHREGERELPLYYNNSFYIGSVQGKKKIYIRWKHPSTDKEVQTYFIPDGKNIKGSKKGKPDRKKAWYFLQAAAICFARGHFCCHGTPQLMQSLIDPLDH